MRAMLRSSAGALLAVLVVVVGSPGAAQELALTSLIVGSETPRRAELPDYLTARLTTQDGSPISQQVVGLHVRADVLGERFAWVGDGITDTSGLARVPFTPRRATYVVRAVFAGTDQHAPVRADAEVRFLADRVVVLTPEPHVHSLLAPVRTVMPLVISALVGLVWVVLIGLATRIVRRIRAAGPFPQED